MKRMLAILAILTAAGMAHAAPSTVITNYLPNYVLVASSFGNAGDTGLTISNAYACIKVSDLTFCSEAQAAKNGAGSDVRAFMYAITKEVYDAIQAQASTNRMAQFTIAERVTYDTSTNADITVSHTINTKQTIGTVTYPSE